MRKLLFLTLCIWGISLFSNTYGQRQMENLDRGLVAMKVTSGVFLSWRVLAPEFGIASYNVYRNGTLITSVSATGASNYTDASGTSSSTYYIKAVIGGIESAASATTSVWANIYKEIPLSRPSKGAKGGSYEPGDCSTGDLNGDGAYEIVVRWQPSNALDPANDGYTDPTIFDAYTLSGTRLWRISLGINVRSNSHYNPFIVYDLNGDGIAEIACKTAPGTKDGTGAYLSTGPAASDNDATDYRSSVGRILTGPEYLTIFNGTTGKEMQTINYEPGRGTITEWGDAYGNRCDRYLACVAYLDGVRPSLVMCRGYYVKTVLVAYNLNGSVLTKLWNFTATASQNSTYQGQGCHSVSVGDVDSDGFDEIIYGACCIDHNGTGKYSTGLGHGDALHLSDLNPDRAGLEVWQPHEDGANNGGVGASFRDANNGSVIFKYSATTDIGRGLCGNILSTTKGVQCWVAASSTLWSCTGSVVGTSFAKAPAFICWWDGNDQRENLTGTACDNFENGRVMTFNNYATATYINGTKTTPNLQADILGDWREEEIFRSSDSTKLIVFSTTIPTSRRIYTLMHDKMYRLGVAWQNVGYNQPPWPSFYIGYGMATPPTINITYPAGAGSAYYTIQNRATALNIDGMGRIGKGDNCGQYAAGKSNNQKWVIENYSSYVKIKNSVTGLYLDGMGLTANGSICGQYTSSSSNNQRWVQELSGTYYKFKNVGTALYLDGGGITTNGANLLQYTSSSSYNQQWIIASVSLTKSAKVSNEVLETENVIEKLKISPNPIYDNTAVLAFGLDVTSDVKVIIYDNLGRSIMQKNMGEFNSGDVKLNLDLNHLDKGSYIIRVVSNNLNTSAKLVKL